MKCNLTQEQMTLTDRIAIETGICHKDSFRKIVLFLHRHPTTISHEVKENRTFLPDIYFLGKDCYFVRKWKEQHIRGDSESYYISPQSALLFRNIQHFGSC